MLLLARRWSGGGCGCGDGGSGGVVLMIIVATGVVAAAVAVVVVGVIDTELLDEMSSNLAQSRTPSMSARIRVGHRGVAFRD